MSRPSQSRTEPRTEHPDAPETHADPPLFVLAPRPPLTAATVALFLVSAALVFGGFWLMSLAFSTDGALAAWIFFGGIACDACGLWLAFGIVPRLEERAPGHRPRDPH